MTRVTVVVIALLFPASTHAAVTAWTNVPVRIYDNAGLSKAERDYALSKAAAILSRASVDIQWSMCANRLGLTATPCEAPMNISELAIRFVRMSVPEAYRGTLPLGDVQLDRRGGGAVLATVYVDRVRWLARSAGADVSLLLGRAVAHELSHLLLATGKHGSVGLMRAIWSTEDVRRGHDSDWILTRDEVAAIQARLITTSGGGIGTAGLR